MQAVRAMKEGLVTKSEAGRQGDLGRKSGSSKYAGRASQAGRLGVAGRQKCLGSLFDVGSSRHAVRGRQFEAVRAKQIEAGRTVEASTQAGRDRQAWRIIKIRRGKLGEACWSSEVVRRQAGRARQAEHTMQHGC